MTCARPSQIRTTTGLLLVALVGTLPAQTSDAPSACLNVLDSRAVDSAAVRAACGPEAVRDLATRVRASAATADTMVLRRLFRPLAQLRDSVLFDVLLEVGDADQATPAVRVLALLAAVGQVDPRIGLRQGTGVGSILADSVESVCPLTLRSDPARVVTLTAPIDPERRLAAAAEGVYGRDGPPPLRLFARCIRLALADAVPGATIQEVVTFTYLCEGRFMVLNRGTDPLDLRFDVEGTTDSGTVHVPAANGTTLVAERGGPVRLRHGSTELGIRAADGRPCPKSVVSGVVRDTSGRPLAEAEVVAYDAGTTARTDPTGAFALTDLDPGAELLVVRAVGYRPIRIPMTMVPGDTTELAVVLTPPSAQVLPEIVVSAFGKRYSRKLADFARRQASSAVPASRFVDPEEFEAWGKFDLGDVLRRTGLVVGGEYASCPNSIRTAGGRNRGGGGLAVYIDGVRIQSRPTFDIRAFPVTWFQAAEVYLRPIETPIEYTAPDTRCVLMLWTKG